MELLRVARCRADVGRRRLVARVALRIVLSPCVGRPPSTLRFALGPYGKPTLFGCGDPEWHFNLAASGECCVIAVTRRGPIGVDVERTDSMVGPLAELADRWFAPEESAEIARCSAPERRAAFLRCWTRREAYLKAIGTGLTGPLDRFAVTVDENPAIVRVDGDDSGPWELVTLHPGNAFIGALAMQASGPRSVVVTESTFDWSSVFSES